MPTNATVGDLIPKIMKAGFSVYDVAEVIVRTERGESQNSIAQAMGIDRGEVCKNIRTAKRFGYLGHPKKWKEFTDAELETVFEIGDEVAFKRESLQN